MRNRTIKRGKLDTNNAWDNVAHVGIKIMAMLGMKRQISNEKSQTVNEDQLLYKMHLFLRRTHRENIIDIN